MNPAQALQQVRRIEQMCDFFESSLIEDALDRSIPVTMPRAPGALGFDIPLWVGLGIVGLWAALGHVLRTSWTRQRQMRRLQQVLCSKTVLERSTRRCP
jgi:hypothetical protein